MNKPFDLEERTYLFARDCRLYIKKLPKTISNFEDWVIKIFYLELKFLEKKLKNQNIGFD